MRQHKKITQRHKSGLKIVKGFKEERTDLNTLVETAWIFAYSLLWNSSLFSTKEINAAKEYIRNYLRSSTSYKAAFLSFCQRVLLARYYINNGAGSFIPLPSVWLTKENNKGFVATRIWYEEIKTIRESLPLYKAEIRALAEAVLEFSEEPTDRNFLYWKSYFIEKQTPGLLTLFQIYVANYFFKD